MAENILQTEWGFVQKLEDPEIRGERAVSYIKERILPGMCENEHIHYAERQFVYVIHGIGKHVINGKTVTCSEGDSFYIPLGAMHQVMNTGTEVLEQLVVSEPILLTMDPEAEREGFSDEVITDAFICDTLSGAVKRLKTETLDHLNMPVTITDLADNVIYQGHMPEQCLQCTSKDCRHFHAGYRSNQEAGRVTGTIQCAEGLTVLVLPVLISDRQAASLYGGYFKSGLSGAAKPDSAFSFTQLFMQDMRTFFLDYFRDAAMAYELDSKRKEMEKEEAYTKSIISAYEQTRDVALNLQVRNHFLFNALNSIAALAVEDGSMQTYKAILNLSDLFRGLLRKEGTRVPLREELEFLNKYLQLQQLRHSGSLQIIWDTSKEADRVIVPHHFLQIIVENSFVHAFTGMRRKKRLIIKTVIANRYIMIVVSDNGCGMDKAQLEALKASLYENSTHGLAMVFRKFTGIYGTDFKFEIDSTPNRGTTYRISLPI